MSREQVEGFVDVLGASWFRESPEVPSKGRSENGGQGKRLLTQLCLWPSSPWSRGRRCVEAEFRARGHVLYVHLLLPALENLSAPCPGLCRY